ncbi:MAG: VOC family protein [Microcella sp.]
MPGIHHVEIWTDDLAAVKREWGWLLQRLGFRVAPEWDYGVSYEANGAYLTFTTSPNLTSAEHDRRRAGLNHLAFHGGSAADVDAIMREAPDHGWKPLYHDRYPHAGGENYYAGWLENAAGFKAEVVVLSN